MNRLTKIIALLAALLALSGGAGTLTAQSLPTLPAASSAPTADPNGQSLDDLVRVLEDPAQRAQLIAALKAHGQTPPPAPAPSTTGPLDGLMQFASDRVDGITSTLADVAQSFGQFPSVFDWLTAEAANPFQREVWWRIFIGIVLALLLGGTAAWTVRRLVGPIASAVPHWNLRQLPSELLRDFGPSVAFLVVGSISLTLAGFSPTERVGRLVIGALLTDRVMTVLFRRLFPWAIASRAARDLRIAARVGLYGAAMLAIAGRLGMPPHFYHLLGNVVFVATALIGSIAIQRARHGIAQSLRDLYAWVQIDSLRSFIPLEAVASYGYICAIGLLWLHYAFWALGVSDGFFFLLRASLLTIVLFLSAQALLLWLGKRDATSQPAAAAELDPAAEGLAHSPPSAMLRFGRLAIKLVALLLVLEAWGLGVISWLASPGGEASLRMAVHLVLTVAFAVGGWIVVNRIANTYLTATDAEGTPVLGNRGRTLTTIARSLILVMVVAMALLSALNEIGLNTGPLLAGAGIVGLAVGFGAQTLVKDIITGLFILLGDTIRVGDVVDLGGSAGGVESMNMRAVTLRGYNGDLITVPYSAIEIVINKTRDYSFWVIDLGIDYGESTERVLAVLKEVTEQMRREWPWRRLILEPLDVAGLDRFDPYSIGIKARIRTRPGDQWRVGREINRRLKLAFEAAGIDMPLPKSVIQVRDSSGGGLSPAVIAAAGAGAPATTAPKG